MTIQQLIEKPDYWLRLKRRFSWHSRKGLEFDPGTPQCGHHVRCLVFLGAILQKNWVELAIRKSGDMWTLPSP